MIGGRFLLMQFEAPLMSFGGPMIDAIGPTRDFPGQAQVAGLLGNALGWHHRDAALLQGLQDRLLLACAAVLPGERLRDYQTVDLGRSHMVGTGWTTRGRVEKRESGSSTGTHIRQRWYLADARLAVAAMLTPADEEPTADRLAEALAYPARPLFIGRKPCLPTAPIGLGVVDAGSAMAALHEAHRMMQADPTRAITVELDARLGGDDAWEDGGELTDERDWRNQMHTGRRTVRRGQRRFVGPA